MRRARLLAPLLALVLQPSLASASNPGGVAIRWDHCYGDAGVQNKNFACDTNSGSEALVGSFVLTSDLADADGLEIVMDLAFAGPTTPSWWQIFLNSGGCRRTSLVGRVVASGTNCPDWSEGEASGGIGAYNIGIRGPNTARLVMASAVPPDRLKFLNGSSEYAAFQLLIDHAKTVGSGACEGCTTPACIVVQFLTVVTPVNANQRRLSGPANLTDSDWAAWQGGGGVVVGSKTGCPAATPTTTRTWGAVKALYH